MASEVGLSAGIQQATQSARMPSIADGLQQVLIPSVPGQPGRPSGTPPKKAPKPVQAPRNMDQGRSFLATAPLAGASDSARQLAAFGNDDMHPAAAGADALPHDDGLLGVVRVDGSRAVQPLDSETGSIQVYLERDRWEEHIRPHHVTEMPQVRGKRTTTYWPVYHTANGVNQ